MMFEITIALYAGINMLAFIWLSFVSSENINTVDTFIYPILYEELDNKNINLLGKIIVFILFTIIFLPAYLLAMLCIGLAYVGFGIIKLFCKIFRKRNE